MVEFRRYLSVRNAFGGTLAPDGQRLAFLTDITGTSQVWTLDGPQRWPDQRSFDDDRVTFVRYNPRRRLLLFGQDHGGNEMDQLSLMDDEGTFVRPLAHMPDRKHILADWAPDGRTVAFTANRDHIAQLNVYVLDVERPDDVRRVFTGEGWNYVAAWLPDSRHMIVGQSTSNTNNTLYLLDTRTGESVHLTPHTDEARYLNVSPLPDASGFFLLSDEGREFLNLAFFDLHTRTLRFLEELSWDREDLSISPDGRWLAMLTNVEGWSELEVRDLSRQEVVPVSGLPRGVAGGLRFAPTEARCRFALTVTTPTRPMDVWVVEPEARRATQWTRSARAGLPESALVEPELVRYRSFDDLLIPALYYRPPNTSPPYPVVIDIHGGPESQRRPTFNAVTQFLVQHGYAVFAPNVRGSTGYGRTYTHLDDVYKRMDAVADIKAAYDWLVTEGGADPRRIALTGGSYGGFMVLACLVTYPDLWAAGVDIVGIANFVTFLENTGPWRRKLREKEYGSLEHDREFLESISPINHVDRIRAPLMVIHGANDPRVPVGEAEQIVRALRERGVPVEYLVYEDEGHGLAKLKNRLDAYPKVAEFLDKYVKNRNAE